MNNIWSENVQGVMTLYLSRKLRFDDAFFEQYKQLFNIDENIRDWMRSRGTCRIITQMVSQGANYRNRQGQQIHFICEREHSGN